MCTYVCTCMYICVKGCTYVRGAVNMWGCMYLSRDVCMWGLMYVCGDICMYVGMYVCMCVGCTYVHMCVCA
jgi:hypothetical protein